jgi:nucleoside-triphosphatase
MSAKILITGSPGVGKTTLIKKLVESLPEAVGFYTEEIRQGGVRKGFRLISLDGKEGVLSHVDFKSRYRVGKYKVDIETFERFIDEIPFSESPVVIIDEIGKMECISSRFCSLVKELLNSDKTVIATIAKKGTPFIEEVKKTQGVMLLELSEQNRESLSKEILALLRRAPLVTNLEMS